jgi:hypothetical protein
MAPPPKKSSAMMWILLIFGGLFLCCCGGGIVASIGGWAALGQQTMMLGMEIEKGRNHPIVIQKVGNVGTQGQPVGQPIMTGTQWKIEQRMTGEKGAANFAIDLQKQADGWTVASSQVKFDDGSVLDLKTGQVSGDGGAVPGDSGMDESTDDDAADKE